MSMATTKKLGKKLAGIVENLRRPTNAKTSPFYYDIFLCYRPASDTENADLIFELLTQAGLKVWRDDKKSSEIHMSWEENIIEGLKKCRIFVPIISRLAINHPDNIMQNFSRLTESSTDSLLITYWLALEMEARGLMELFYPVLIGDYNAETEEITNYFKSGCHPKLEETCTLVRMQNKILKLLAKAELDEPYFHNVTVAEIFEQMMSHPGLIMEGDRSEQLVTLARNILALDELEAYTVTETVEIMENPLASRTPKKSSIAEEAPPAPCKRSSLRKSYRNRLSGRDVVSILQTVLEDASISYNTFGSIKLRGENPLHLTEESRNPKTLQEAASILEVLQYQGTKFNSNLKLRHLRSSIVMRGADVEVEEAGAEGEGVSNSEAEGFAGGESSLTDDIY